MRAKSYFGNRRDNSAPTTQHRARQRRGRRRYSVPPARGYRTAAPTIPAHGRPRDRDQPGHRARRDRLKSRPTQPQLSLGACCRFEVFLTSICQPQRHDQGHVHCFGDAASRFTVRPAFLSRQAHRRGAQHVTADAAFVRIKAALSLQSKSNPCRL
jgi:hypothetical protein